MSMRWFEKEIGIILTLNDWEVVIREAERLHLNLQDWIIRAIEIEIATCEAARLSIHNADAIPFGSPESTDAGDKASETPRPNAGADADA